MSTAESYDRPTYTIEQYFAIEKDSEIRHEFHSGEIFCMAGASLNHNRISSDGCTALNNSMKGCEAFSSDMRTEVELDERYCYPDIVVVCGDIVMSEKYKNCIANPYVVVEVLSTSTAKFDRGTKADRYKEMKTLKHYVLVSQDRMLVEHHIKRGNIWAVRLCEEAHETLNLDCGKLNVGALYKRVEFK
jgi:Uma2 family endonuclease